MRPRTCASIPLLVVDRLDEGRIDDGVEHMRRLRHGVGEARRRAEKIGEEQAQAIVRLQDGQELDGRRHAAEGAVERERGAPSGSAVPPSAASRAGHELGQHLAGARARDRRAAAEMPAAHGLRRAFRVAEAEPAQRRERFRDRRPCR